MHFMFGACIEPTGGEGGGPGRKAWSPTEEELREGFKFIGSYNGEFDPNKMLEWLTIQTRACRNSPIFGWPSNLVKEHMTNTQKQMNVAEIKYFYPLLIWDLKDVLVKQVLPLIVAFGFFRGVLWVGHPNKGKTPTCESLSMGMSRFNVKRFNLDRRPGMRRGNQLDSFRAICNEVQMSIMLDDPNLAKLIIEEIMAHGDSSQTGHSDARYISIRWVKNMFKSWLTNVFCAEHEPEGPLGHTIDHAT